jgi:5-methylcytosine-specific restriction endonuclease McrA
MTDPRPRLSRRARIRIFDAAGGTCHICGLPIHAATGEAWEAEHKIPRWAGGTDDESNLAPAHKDCHAAKSGSENTTRSKTDRQRADYLLGRKQSKKPLPGGRDTSISITFSGPQRRMSQAEKHRVLMAKRQIGGNYGQD